MYGQLVSPHGLFLQQPCSLQQSPQALCAGGASARAVFAVRATAAATIAACQYRINMGRTSLFLRLRSRVSGCQPDYGRSLIAKAASDVSSNLKRKRPGGQGVPVDFEILSSSPPSTGERGFRDRR